MEPGTDLHARLMNAYLRAARAHEESCTAIARFAIVDADVGVTLAAVQRGRRERDRSGRSQSDKSMTGSASHRGRA